MQFWFQIKECYSFSACYSLFSSRIINKIADFSKKHTELVITYLYVNFAIQVRSVFTYKSCIYHVKYLIGEHKIVSHRHLSNQWEERRKMTVTI